LADSQTFVHERQKLLKALLAVLSPMEQAVLEHRFHREMSQEVVAEALGLSRQKIRTIEMRIRTKALKIFKKSGYLPSNAGLATSTLLLTLLLKGGR
jgi:RNA polymerase sigma factor (sigma-70 family)